MYFGIQGILKPQGYIAVETFMIFLVSLALVCVSIYLVARLFIHTWSRSLTRQTETLERVNTILEHLSRDLGDTMDSSEGGVQSSLFFGSSNFRETAGHTSTYSPHLQSSDIGSVDLGTKSQDKETSSTSSLEPMLKNSAPGAMGHALTHQNMRQKMSKRSCRICSKIRAWVDGGV